MSELVEEQPTHTYEEALEESIKYFDGNELSAKVFLDKYALRNKNGDLIEKTPEDMHRRISKEFARIEQSKFNNTNIKPFTEDEIYEYLKEFKNIIPQGSPMYGIGNYEQYVSTSNCFVIESPEDSYSGIMKADEELIQICKRRGGVGVDISTLRPYGSSTRNSSRTSTGIIPFMERYSNSIREVGQENRRGALMITIDVHHPEAVKLDGSPDFCSVKKDLKKVTGANISLRLSDEFLKAVENDEEYEVRFPVDYKEKGIEPKISYTQNARNAWKKIIHHAWDNAEPGLLFWDNITNESPADCYSEYGFETKSTNPCGEIPLNPGDSCRLLLVNTFGSVKNPYSSNAEFDWEKFKQNAYIAQRLMDDMIDLELQAIERIIRKINHDPESKEIKDRELKLWNDIQKKCKWGRRTGTGITALGDTMASLGIKYGSKESIKFTEEVYKTLKLGAYRASVDISKELSPFPIWNAEKEAKNPFLLRLKEDDEELYNDMQKYGRRNIALLTTAPAGSVSLLACMDVNGNKYFNTTSGIEPQYSIIPYIRKRKINPSDKNSRIDETDSNGDSWQRYSVYPSGVKAWMDLTGESDVSKSPYSNSSAEELDWSKRVELQSTATKHIDHSISSTINLPNDVTEEEVANIYEKAWKLGCKGITVYRDGCRTGVLTKDNENKEESSNKIIKTNAPKRPKSLECDIFHPTLKGEKYYVVVGLYKNDPYEVFTGLNKDEEGNSFIPKSVENGTLTKKSRGKYLLTSNEKEYSLTNGHSDDNAEAITRLISTSLRHGADISFIVHQLEKTKGDLLSFSKVLARTLKKYIKDETKVYGEQCPSCEHGDTLQRREGCITCVNCGFTKCG